MIRQCARYFMLLLAWACIHVPCVDAQDSPQPTDQPSRSARPAESARPGPSRPDGKPAEGNEAEEDQEKKSESGDGAEVIDRPMEPTMPPDPKELEVRPADDGKLAFNFRNQPWVSLLEWFAEIADQPLDWRQLPGDHVNLASSGRYTLDEVFDLLNRHLLARGFTMVRLDDGLMVLKTEGINPALVPRVEAERLTSLQPHQFVRASMDAGWLSAEELAEELEPMISRNGRLVAMKSTNRIEAMDAATNLRQIFELLQQELSSDARDHLAPEFELRYISAEDAKEMLEQFLGIEEKESVSLTPQQIQQLQQQRSRSSRSGNAQQPPAQEKKPKISIVANTRRNSVLIQAPADRLAIAQEFIKRIDVPSDSIISLADVESRVEAFRLVSLDPEKLIEIVQDMNILEPSTRIRIDADSRAVIVSGAAADRFIIKSLIERLDGSGREFYVLPVRYRDPRAVAESISFLMGKDKKDERNSRSSRSYGYYGFSSRREEPKQEDEFRVTADVQFRQVLVWANEIELSEVRTLLVKLGEIPPEEGSRRAVRVLDVAPTPETYEYLKRLKEQFQQIAPNEFELPPRERFNEPNRRPEKEEESATKEDEKADGQEKAGDNGDGTQELPPLTEDPLARHSSARGSFFTAAMQTGSSPPTGEQETENDREPRIDPAEIDPRSIRSTEDFDRLFGNRDEANRAAETEASPDAASENGDPAPLEVSVDRDGRIVVRSRDTDALDRLEDLMLQLTPPKRPYRVFHVEHASAYWVQLNLEDYFSEEDKEDDRSSRRYYFYGYQGDDDRDAATGLDQQRKMRMVSDPDTNTIVVTGGTPEQLRTIEELIELWDVPEPVDKRKVRYTKLIPVKYSRAEKIAETVKEAYRDLLSSNDKAFTQGNRGSGGRRAQQNQAERSRNGGGSELVDDGRGGQIGGSNFDFKGKLAIGIDEVGNNLLVTAEGEELLKLVVGMIEQLDTAAQPQGDVRIHKVAGSINVSTLEAALRVLSSEATPQSAARSPEPSRRGRPERGLGEVGNGDEPPAAR